MVRKKNTKHKIPGSRRADVAEDEYDRDSSKLEAQYEENSDQKRKTKSKKTRRKEQNCVRIKEFQKNMRVRNSMQDQNAKVDKDSLRVETVNASCDMEISEKDTNSCAKEFTMKDNSGYKETIQVENNMTDHACEKSVEKNSTEEGLAQNKSYAAELNDSGRESNLLQEEMVQRQILFHNEANQKGQSLNLHEVEMIPRQIVLYAQANPETNMYDIDMTQGHIVLLHHELNRREINFLDDGNLGDDEKSEQESKVYAGNIVHAEYLKHAEVLQKVEYFVYDVNMSTEEAMDEGKEFRTDRCAADEGREGGQEEVSYEAEEEGLVHEVGGVGEKPNSRKRTWQNRKEFWTEEEVEEIKVSKDWRLKAFLADCRKRMRVNKLRTFERLNK